MDKSAIRGIPATARIRRPFNNGFCPGNRPAHGIRQGIGSEKAMEFAGNVLQVPCLFFRCDGPTMFPPLIQHLLKAGQGVRKGSRWFCLVCWDALPTFRRFIHDTLIISIIIPKNALLKKPFPIPCGCQARGPLFKKHSSALVMFIPILILQVIDSHGTTCPRGMNESVLTDVYAHMTRGQNGAQQLPFFKKYQIPFFQVCPGNLVSSTELLRRCSRNFKTRLSVDETDESRAVKAGRRITVPLIRGIFMLQRNADNLISYRRTDMGSWMGPKSITPAGKKQASR